MPRKQDHSNSLYDLKHHGDEIIVERKSVGSGDYTIWHKRQTNIGEYRSMKITCTSQTELLKILTILLHSPEKN